MFAIALGVRLLHVWQIRHAPFFDVLMGDARGYDGTLSIIQPLIALLYRTHTAIEVLAAFSDKPGQIVYDAVRERMKAAYTGTDFEKFWRKTLNDGFAADSAYAPVSAALNFNPANLPALKTPPSGQLEFIFRPDPGVYDGRYANNGWLQELARPITKLTWDNAALVSPKTAESLGLTHSIAHRGG